MHSYPPLLDNYIFDIFLHRSNDQGVPFRVITAPLTLNFQKQFGEKFISIIEDNQIYTFHG